MMDWTKNVCGVPAGKKAIDPAPQRAIDPDRCERAEKMARFASVGRHHNGQGYGIHLKRSVAGERLGKASSRRATARSNRALGMPSVEEVRSEAAGKLGSTLCRYRCRP
jgi:hypothetical protein